MSELTSRLDNVILSFYRRVLRTACSTPFLIPFFLKVIHDQVRAARRRKSISVPGDSGAISVVPPFMIASLTAECNLGCSGCYSRAIHQVKNRTMPLERWSRLFMEAESIGISTVLLAGGEPFLRQDIISVAATRKKILFPVFTNGLCIDSSRILWLRRHRNVIPVVSIEGGEKETDKRRGPGVYGSILARFREFRKARLFFGVSITVSRENYDVVTRQDFVRSMIRLGARLFIFVEYVPVEEGLGNLILTSDQKTGLAGRCDALQDGFPALFVAFPGDENIWGGCLAAGRGFIHVNASGMVEACPFAPFSDTDLKDASLLQALSSPLMRSIRENHHLLAEGTGGCALWGNRERIPGLEGFKNR